MKKCWLKKCWSDKKGNYMKKKLFRHQAMNLLMCLGKRKKMIIPHTKVFWGNYSFDSLRRSLKIMLPIFFHKK